MIVAFLLFEGITALDVVGPYEVLTLLPGADVRFVADEAGPKTTEDGALQLVAKYALDEVREPDIIVIPGGFGTRAVMQDEAILAWLRNAHETARWTTSVCTGSLVLGAAGLLDGLRATSHWYFLDRLREFGAEPTAQRVVEEGRIVTAAGVSSGIDMALALAAREAGPDVAQAIQLAIEYDPQPPFDSGSPSKAPGHVLELVSKGVEAQEPAAG